MEFPVIRQRSGYLFVAVLIGHIIIISAQVPASSRSEESLLETIAFGVFSEIQGGASAVIGGVRHTWRGYVALRGAHAENQLLKRQVADLQIQLQQQRALAERSRQLQQLLDLRDRSKLSTAAATVIATGATPDFRTLTIDKGSKDGLLPDMAVIAPAGAVGRVVLPSAGAAKVQLLIDRNAAAGALVERTRAQGVVIGGGDDRLRLEYVPDTADVRPGDTVVTSGIDGIYPKGIVIGRIESVARGTGSYKVITVRPAVDFSSLEEVLVVIAPAIDGGPPEGSE